MQAAFRRRLGRTYRGLLRQAIVGLEAALQQVNGASEVGPEEMMVMEGALGAYHAHLGRFSAIFSDYEPRAYRQLNEAHQMQRELALKAAYLEEKGASLELHLCPLLCAASAWAGAKWGGGKQARAEGMLHYSDHLIHKPLCQVELIAPEMAGSKKEVAKASKELLAQYKNLFGFLGLKRTADPEALAGEWLSYGKKHPSMRAELYVSQYGYGVEPLTHASYSILTYASADSQGVGLVPRRWIS